MQNITIPKTYKSLKFSKAISWKEIFEEWKRGEERQESWKKHWKERGYSSWEEWRKNYAAPLNPEKLEWFLFEITDPIQDFPNIFGVPSHGWIKKAYNGERTKQLKDIINFPIILENPKVLDIRKKFPEKTMFTGIVFKDKIILVEGMHRALALAGWDKNRLLESEITIALANWPESEVPIIGSGWKK